MIRCEENRLKTVIFVGLGPDDPCSATVEARSGSEAFFSAIETFPRLTVNKQSDKFRIEMTIIDFETENVDCLVRCYSALIRTMLAVSASKMSATLIILD